jgi:Xaa-Pro dipeptidase
MAANIKEIQSDLRAAKLHGWLFCDFRERDPIAQRILGLPPGMRTRRWYYFVPAKGTPRKLVHKIETESLASLPGETLYYAGQEELRKNLGKLFGGSGRIAMQYSPKNEIPYVAMVDAGTIELVRSCGAKVVSSADLVQKYEACWTPEQLESHLAAGKDIDRIVRGAFQEAATAVRKGTALTEYDLKKWILREFEVAGIWAEEGPDIAVNAHASDPHGGTDSRRRFAAAGRLGEKEDSWQRLLRHYLDRVPWREGSGKICQGFSCCARRKGQGG